jgi:hypothetical protein
VDQPLHLCNIHEQAHGNLANFNWSMDQTRLLAVSINNFVGSLPDSIGNWKSLTVFGVSTNKMTGQLPTSIGNWTNLDIFDVYNTKLRGTLPTCIGKWTKLTIIHVGTSSFTGTIPSEISSWKSIQEAYFDTNSFNGSMPVIGNNFCPKNITGTSLILTADCKAPAKVTCPCCNTCY